MTAHPTRRNSWRALLAAALLASAGSAPAATFVVNSRLDDGTGGCTALQCTLREAIVAANTTTAADTINFDIDTPARGEILIQPTSALPTITQPVTINGYSQNGTRANDDPVASNAVLRIRVDGLNAGATSPGLAICANNVTIKGLSITRFLQIGIHFGADAAGVPCSGSIAGGVVAGNFIGLTSNGTTAAGNLGGGVFATAAQFAVGSTAPADRNVIGDNSGPGGVGLVNAGSSNSSVLGNLIGTDRSGALDRGNIGPGVVVAGAAASVLVGSTSAPNRIAFNAIGVVVRSTSGNRLFANHYGPNDGLGIELLDAAFAGGVSLNDAGDGDAGGNGQQNYLQDGFTADRTPSGINIQGSLLRSSPIGGLQTFSIAAYATPACDGSGHGEGEQFLGAMSEVTATATAPIDVDIPLAAQPPAGSFITTTVTAPGGSTSEFSTCAPLDPPPLVVTSTADTDGTTCGATCTLRQAINVANLTAEPDVIQFAINPGVTVGELLIQPIAALPTVTAPVLIDGYTQSGTSVNTNPVVSNAVLRIRLDGTSAGAASGLVVCSRDVTIRGLSVTGFNLSGISFGRQNTGVSCPSSPTSGQVLGSFIGLASDGSTPLGNQGSGITAASVPITVGTAAAADRNVIGSNGSGGVFLINLDASGSRIVGNLLGTDKSGELDRGNTTGGVFIATNVANTIVGEAAAPNLIRFNGNGIALPNTNTVSGNVWSQNRIFSNDALGIDLNINLNGVTANDDNDADAGANGRQNFPVLTKAERSSAGIVIGGTLDVKVGTGNVPYTIGVYANAACDGSGHGEGERLLGAATVNLTKTTGESFSFELTTDDALEPGVQITSIATGPEGSSEFSSCVAATDAPPGIAVNSTDDPGTGACDAAECTLREAIALANTQVGADLIRFTIPGDGPHEIRLASLLPTITEALTIDGYTQPGASENAAESQHGSDAVLKIEVNGLGSQLFLLRTCSNGAVEVRGLALGGASAIAIVTRLNDTNDCTASGSLIVKGNSVGVRAAGSAFGNGAGISAFGSPATIGGNAPEDRNIISGNDSFGVRIVGVGANGSTVQNNLIGTGSDPAVDRGNNGAGVEINGAFNVTVGGEGDLANLIAFNGGGILLAFNGSGNRVYANEFVANGSLGIDLSPSNTFDGVTPNDANDPDPGPNKLQNFPQLSDGTATAGSITINGTLDVPAGIVAPLAYTLAFYESATCDGSHGEGEIYLGSRQVDFTDTESGQAFSETLAIPPSAGASVITATATDPEGNTSEFSNCLVGPQVPLPVQIFVNGFEG